MIFFKILNIRNTIKDTQDMTQNPGGFIGGEIKKTLLGYGIASLILSLGFFAVLFLFGFTDTFGDPSGFARFIFYIFLFIFICVGFWILFIVSLVKKIKKGIVDKKNASTIQITKDVVVEDQI
jgi:hypothetical protein